MKAPAASYQHAQLQVSCYGINLTGHPELWFREPQALSHETRIKQLIHSKEDAI